MTSAAFMSKLILKLIAAYRYFLSPFIGQGCRFHPSCSHYAQEAIEKHGALAGCRLGLGRLLRCHPFHPGGIDPVPETLSAKGRARARNSSN